MRHALANRRTRDLAMLLLVVAFTAFWFHGLFAHLGDSVLAGPNDETYSIRTYWAADFFGKTPFTFHRDPLNGAPEGLGLSTAVQVANAVIPATIWMLHYLVGLTAAENIFLLAGFMLTGFAVYLLLDRLGFHPLAAIYAAYVVMFNPWMIERAYAGHHGFMQAWVFPLLIATLLYMHRSRSALSAALAGAALALAFYESSYYGLLASLVYGVFMLVDFVQQPSWRERLWSFTLLDVSALSALVAFTPAVVAWRGDRHAVAASISNPTVELQSGGASLASYLMPGTRNPVLGGITTHFYPLANFKWSENTLYLGWSLIALAVVGAVLVVRRDPETLRTPLVRYFTVCILVLAPAAFICSLKRKTSVLGLEIPMPAYFIGHVTTFWRVFARFGVLVTLSCAILAALALTVAARRHRYGKWLAIAAIAVIAFEYNPGFPHIYRLSPAPAWATWVRAQPPGIVANYPMPTDKPQALTLLAETYFDQIYSHHPQFMLFGSGYGGTREDAIRILSRYVTDPVTPGILKAEHVRYVLLHDDVYREQGDVPPGIPAGFHLVGRLPGNVRVLELNADVKPVDLTSLLAQDAASIALVQGLPAPTWTAAGGLKAGSDGSLTLHGDGALALRWPSSSLTRLQFLIHADAIDQPRTLQLLDADGQVAGSASIGIGDTGVVLGPVDVSGTSASFTLHAEPPGEVVISSIQVQPLANVTKSILDD
jgi:hypothetical protein